MHTSMLCDGFAIQGVKITVKLLIEAWRNVIEQELFATSTGIIVANLNHSTVPIPWDNSIAILKSVPPLLIAQSNMQNTIGVVD